jgi:hypothetical protein
LPKSTIKIAAMTSDFYIFRSSFYFPAPNCRFSRRSPQRPPLSAVCRLPEFCCNFEVELQ